MTPLLLMLACATPAPLALVDAGELVVTQGPDRATVVVGQGARIAIGPGPVVLRWIASSEDARAVVLADGDWLAADATASELPLNRSITLEPESGTSRLTVVVQPTTDAPEGVRRALASGAPIGAARVVELVVR